MQAADLPTDDLGEPGRTFFVYRNADEATVGYGGYERYGEDALVRSLVALPEARGKGVGGQMLVLLLRRASEEGARHAWLLTTTAADFFRKTGFRTTERRMAPASILATRHAASLCPASAVLMTRAISV